MPTEASGNSSRTIAAVTGSNNVLISRECADGMNLLVVESAPVSEFHLTITPRPSESPAAKSAAMICFFEIELDAIAAGG